MSLVTSTKLDKLYSILNPIEIEELSFDSTDELCYGLEYDYTLANMGLLLSPAFFNDLKCPHCNTILKGGDIKRDKTYVLKGDTNSTYLSLHTTCPYCNKDYQLYVYKTNRDFCIIDKCIFIYPYTSFISILNNTGYTIIKSKHLISVADNKEFFKENIVNLFRYISDIENEVYSNVKEDIRSNTYFDKSNNCFYANNNKHFYYIIDTINARISSIFSSDIGVGKRNCHNSIFLYNSIQKPSFDMFLYKDVDIYFYIMENLISSILARMNTKQRTRLSKKLNYYRNHLEKLYFMNTERRYCDNFHKLVALLRHISDIVDITHLELQSLFFLNQLQFCKPIK